MRRWLPLWALATASCSPVSSTDDMVPLGHQSFAASREEVWAACRKAWDESGFPLRSDQDGALRSRRIDVPGGHWRMHVKLGPPTSPVTVACAVESHVSSSFRPSAIGLDDLFETDAERERSKLERRWQEDKVTYLDYVRRRQELDEEIRLDDERKRVREEKEDRRFSVRRENKVLEGPLDRATEFQRSLGRILENQ